MRACVSETSTKLVLYKIQFLNNDFGLRSTQLTVLSDVSGSLNKMVMSEKNYAADPGYTVPPSLPPPL